MNTVFIKNNIIKISRQVIICAVICAVILAVLFVLPQDAYALNSDYMNYGKWMNNEKVTSYTLNYENAGNTLTGKFRFYTDSSLGVYTDFEISETSLGEADNVCVTYDFHMPGEDFIVYVDRYGLSEGSNEQGKSVFKAEANFKKGTYLSAAQYVGGTYDSCYVDITLFINGHNYKITKNKKLYGEQLYMELPTTVTTTRSTTLRSTAKKAAKKTKKSTTQKKKSTGSVLSKSKAAARAKISTTKFKPNYNITTAAKQQKTQTNKTAAVKSTAAVNNSDASEEAQISQESAEGGDKFEINPQAKQFFPLLLIIVIIGVAALCIGAAKNKKEKKDGKEEENKEENDE